MLLTEKQLEELQPLAQHPKYGKLLSNAIGNWKQFRPMRWGYGISSKLLDDGSDVFIGEYGCCLIGAALIGKKCNWRDREATHEHCMKLFEISEEEILSLISGFDDTIFDDDHYKMKAPLSKEAYDFGYTIGEIIFNHG